MWPGGVPDEPLTRRWPATRAESAWSSELCAGSTEPEPGAGERSRSRSREPVVQATAGAGGGRKTSARRWNSTAGGPLGGHCSPGLGPSTAPLGVPVGASAIRHFLPAQPKPEVMAWCRPVSAQLGTTGDESPLHCTATAHCTAAGWSRGHHFMALRVVAVHINFKIYCERVHIRPHCVRHETRRERWFKKREHAKVKDPSISN